MSTASHISTRALRFYVTGYLFAGINIYAANLFAALNNGKISTFLSALRMFVFQLAAVLLLPLLLGSDGIWLAMPCAELCVFVVTLAVFHREHEVYSLY